MEEPDFQLLAKMHTRDMVWLVAVLMRVKPITTLVVPLEVREWLQGFSEEKYLIYFEDGPADSYQTRVTVSCDEEIAKAKRKLGQVRSLFDHIRETPIMSCKQRAHNEFLKALTWLEGTMHGYPKCCIEFHAERGPSSRARAYEEFLNSGRDQSIPIEFWTVAHSPCSSTCEETLHLGRKYLDAVARLSESLRNHVESRLVRPRFYQTGGGRFIDLQPLDYDRCREALSISKEHFEQDARSRLPTPVEIILCDVPRPYVLVDAPEEPPYKISFPNPEMIGTMWLAYTPGFGAYMVNAKTGRLALYILSDNWIPKVGEEWRSRSNFRIYSSVKG